MKELNEMVNAAMQKMTECGQVEQIVQAKLEATIKDIIDSELRSYSTFGKALTEHIQGALNVNFNLLNFDGYNTMVLKIIQRMLDGRLEEATDARLKDDLDTLLGHPPGHVSLSSLIADFIEQEAEEAGEDMNESITFIWKDDGSFSYASWDKAPGRSRQLCAYQIGFHDGVPFSFRIDHHNPKERLFMGKLYEFDRKLFQIYAAGVPVVIDVENVNTDYPTRDY